MENQKQNRKPKRQTSRISSFFLSLSALFLLLTAPVLTSCGVSQGASNLPTERNAPSLLISGIDDSASDRHDLPVVVGEHAELLPKLNSNTWIDLFRFDSSVEEIHAGPLDESLEDYLNGITSKIVPLSNRDNTYLNLLFREFVDRARKANGPVVITVETDGFLEGMSPEDHLSLTAFAEALAKNDHVKVVILEGVDPANMARIGKDLAPLDAKLRYFDIGKVDQNLIANLLSGGTR